MYNKANETYQTEKKILNIYYNFFSASCLCIKLI